MAYSASDDVASFSPIAIVGLGLRAPGAIDSAETLWDTLENHKSHSARLYTDPRFLRRFNPSDFKSMFSVTADAKETLQGNLLEETPGLDEAFFGVSKRESAAMDVQIKLLLHVAHEALEDAGYNHTSPSPSFNPANFGVYVGSSTDDFFKDPDSYDVDLYHLIYNQRAFLSGQISHKFGFHGPAVAVDTVCAGSMTAINDACRALSTGECNAAIAGGVHVMTPISAPPTVMALKLAGFLDPTGQCKPFLANGGGYSRAEGCGLLVLKRLEDALQDGDRIHGVIRGVGAGNMASPRSIIRPDGDLQGASLARALSCSGIDPSQISFVEAHGPGTQKGDLAELHSICSVLAPPGSRPLSDPLVIGSIKGNVGHSEAAAGVLSIIKVLTMMKLQKMAPQADFHPSKLNPRLQHFFDNHAIEVAEHEQAWERDRRVAVVSSFGASGYAGHVIIEDVASHALPAASRSISHDLPFLISAKDKEALLSLVKSYAGWLGAEGASEPLESISYTMTARRTHHPYSILVHASSHTDLAQQLRDEPKLYIHHRPQQPRQLAYCFSGQGGPRVDPAQSPLYHISAVFRSMVDTCYNLSAQEQLVAPEDVETLELFTLEVALAEMWTTWGLSPIAVAGHSFGEYAALVRAGVISLKDALRLLGTRAALVRTKCAQFPGAMAALRLPLTDVRQLLREQKQTRVELACINSQTQVTLAGTTEDLETFHRRVQALFPTARWVLINNMRAAFHSRFVEPIREEYFAACADVTFSAPQISVLSGPLGTLVPPGDGALTQIDYLVRHCLETNAFGEAIQDYYTYNAQSPDGHPDWLEMGPHATAVNFIPSASPTQLNLSSQRKGCGEWSQIIDALSKLQSAGHEIDFQAFHRDVNPMASPIDLPRYPLRSQPHSYPVRKVIVPSAPPTYSPRVTSAELSPMLKSHVVANQSICPASAYVSLAMASTSSYREGRHGFRASRLVMASPFTGQDGDWLQVSSKPDSTFEVHSKSGQLHASLRIELYEEARLLEQLNSFAPLISNLRSAKGSPDVSILDKRLAYGLFGQTVSYGTHCQHLERVWITGDGSQAWALSSNEPDDADDGFEPPILREFSPVLIDRACQLIGLLVNTSSARGPGEIFVASEIDQMEVAYSKVRDSKVLESFASFEIFKGSSSENVTAVGQVYTFDEHNRLVAAFRGIRMRRMKQDTLGMLIRRTLPSPPVLVLPKPVQAVYQPRHPLPSPPPEPVECVSHDRWIHREAIQAVFRKTLGMDNVPEDKNLVDLGLDSLTAVEIGFKLENLTPSQKVSNELMLQPYTTLKTLFDSLNLSPPLTSATTTLLRSTLSPPTFKHACHADPILESRHPLPSPPPEPADSTSQDDSRIQREAIQAVFRKTLGMDNVPEDKNLVDLGLDSLTAVEIGFKLENLTPSHRVSNELMLQPYTTLKTLFDSLNLSPASSSTTTTRRRSTLSPHTKIEDPTLARAIRILEHLGPNPEVLRPKPHSTLLPIVLIHDGGGTTMAYRLLGDIGRTVLGIHCPGMKDGQGIKGIRHAADEYASFIRHYLSSSSTSSRVLVGGWSMGGTIAATLAAAHPDLVAGVILLDPPPPGVTPMKQDESEFLIPREGSQPSSGFNSLVRKQLVMNARALASDADYHGSQPTLFRNVQAPVYLITAVDEMKLPHQHQRRTFAAGSCAEWMTSPKRASISEAAWSLALGDRLVGTRCTDGDHFSMFTVAHSGATTSALLHAIKALEF